MTDLPEPDSNPASAILAADLLARKFLAAVDTLLERVDKLHPNDNLHNNIMGVQRRWIDEYLPSLVDTAAHYRAVRDAELDHLDPEPFSDMDKLQWIRHEELVEGEYKDFEQENLLRKPSEPNLANLISSRAKTFSTGFGPRHIPLIDIDLPCELRPSKTPGHYHLIIHHWVHDELYWEMLDVMARAGIVQVAFVELSRKRGATHIRAFPTASGWRNETERNNSPVTVSPAVTLPEGNCDCGHSSEVHDVEPNGDTACRMCSCIDFQLEDTLDSGICGSANCYHPESMHQSNGRCYVPACRCEGYDSVVIPDGGPADLFVSNPNAFVDPSMEKMCAEPGCMHRKVEHMFRMGGPYECSMPGCDCGQFKEPF